MLLSLRFHPELICHLQHYALGVVSAGTQLVHNTRPADLVSQAMQRPTMLLTRLSVPTVDAMRHDRCISPAPSYALRAGACAYLPSMRRLRQIQIHKVLSVSGSKTPKPTTPSFNLQANLHSVFVCFASVLFSSPCLHFSYCALVPLCSSRFTARVFISDLQSTYLSAPHIHIA